MRVAGTIKNEELEAKIISKKTNGNVGLFLPI